MHAFPSLPAAGESPELFEEGHLWIQELVVGRPVRFRLESSGVLGLSDPDGPIDADDPPPSLRATAEHVASELDRGALLDAAADPSSVVIYGVATRFEGVPYDWDRLSPFLGTDVWSGERGEYLPPDAVERTVERLGLTPVTAVEKEVDARHFDPGSYDIPASAWYDGPAAGVVFRNKRGSRAALRNPAARRPVDPLPSAPADLAAAVTPDRVERVAGRLDDPAFGALLEATVTAVAREEHARLPAGVDLTERSFRSAVADRLRELRS